MRASDLSLPVAGRRRDRRQAVCRRISAEIEDGPNYPQSPCPQSWTEGDRIASLSPIPQECGNVWSRGRVAFLLVSLLISIVGLVACFRANAGRDNRAFLERYLCLSVPLGPVTYALYYAVYCVHGHDRVSDGVGRSGRAKLGCVRDELRLLHGGIGRLLRVDAELDSHRSGGSARLTRRRRMTKYYSGALGSVGLISLLGGCSVTRPIPVALDAPALSSYLAEHPAANLRVTDRSGDRYWIHAPKIQGDSLIGRRGYDVPARPASVHLDEVAELRTGHFSLGRTGAAIGGGIVAAGVALAILVENAQPIY